jgi:hypothetical protein
VPDDPACNQSARSSSVREMADPRRRTMRRSKMVAELSELLRDVDLD